jgi:hypothetical protein
LYSGGINISGREWGREQDNIGIGCGRLDGPEQTDESILYTQVAEGYARFGLNDYLLMTFDLQYMKRQVCKHGQRKPRGRLGRRRADDGGVLMGTTPCCGLCRSKLDRGVLLDSFSFNVKR